MTVITLPRYPSATRALMAFVALTFTVAGTGCSPPAPMDSGVIVDAAPMDIPNPDSGSCNLPAMQIDSNRDGVVSCLELQDFIDLERPNAMDPRIACLLCQTTMDTCSTPACDQPAAARIEFSVRCNAAHRWELGRFNVCPLPDVPTPPIDTPNSDSSAGGDGSSSGGSDSSVADGSAGR